MNLAYTAPFGKPNGSGIKAAIEKQIQLVA